MKSLLFGLTTVMLLCVGCLPKPDGGYYWVFKHYAPVLAGGDGQSYQTAYHFKYSSADGLRLAENEVVRDKYWITPQRRYEDFWHIVPPAKVSCADSIKSSTLTHDSRIYDIVTFDLPEGRRTLYFEVTKYRQVKEH
jgi:hypothetical protein